MPAILAALFVTVPWSSSWVLVRVGLDEEDLPPLTFAGLRYTVAVLALLAWTLSRPANRRQIADVPTRSLRRLAALGLIHIAVTQRARFVAIDAQPAATSSLMLAPTAFLDAVLSGRSIGERAGPLQYVGAALVPAGAVLYSGGDLARPGSA